MRTKISWVRTGLFLFILAAACSCGTREKCDCPHFSATSGPASAWVPA